MLKTLLGSARWLYRLEEMGYDRGNWQMAGSSSLIGLAEAVPEFKQAKVWAQMGAQRLIEHAEVDFFKTGCHSERCPASYMFGVYSTLEKTSAYLKAMPAYAEASGRIDASLERSAEFWMYMINPSGHLAGINDGHRRVFKPSTLLDAASRSGRKDFLFVAQNLLGAEIDGDVTPPKHTSMNFADSGFAAMRSDWRPQARYMLLNYGPDAAGSHTHRDILDFEINAFGQVMAIDAGIGISYSDPLNNVWYNASRAHNMLVVDDGEIDRASAECEDVVWDSQSVLDYFAATTRGWEKDATVIRMNEDEIPMVKGKGVVWRRHIAFVKTRLLDYLRRRHHRRGRPYAIVVSALAG